MGDKKLRIGIVGAGGIVKSRHLPGLRLIEGVEIAAVANSSLDSARRFCSEHLPDAEPMAEWEVLVRRDDLDIVWIGATPYMHKPVTLAALEAGKHVFCQARMARNLEESQEMLAASEKHPDLVTMLCPPPFGLCKDAFFKRLVHDRVAGDIRHLRLRIFNDDYLDPSLPIHWRQRRDISGNNIMSLGIFIEILQRWFGDISKVTAEGRVFTTTRSGMEVDVPEQLDVLCVFKSGVTGSLHFNCVYPGRGGNRLHAAGSTGLLEFDFSADAIFLQEPGHSPVPMQAPKDLQRPWRVERDFIEAVRKPGAPRPRPTFRDGVAYMRVVDAVQESMRSGGTVRLEVPN